MRIPNKVKIGAHEYEVIQRSDEGENDKRFGHCYSRNLKIYIDGTVPSTQQEETLIHEALHAICEQVYAFPRNDAGNADEERIVQSLGHGIYHFLKENNLLTPTNQ